MLAVENLFKSFAGRPLLRGIGFRVAAAETVCLLGPSGSGKSTILRLIAGLERPDAGRITWDGRDLATVPVHRRRFGLVFQDYALFPHLSVLENVTYALRWQNVARNAAQALGRDLLRQVDMEDKADRRVTDLSGGEQQRVALARTLAARPRLLMFDEPLGALDYNLRAHLLDFLQGFLRRQRKPALYVTHDYEEAFALAQRVILLHEGRIVQQGRPEDLVQRPRTPWVARFLGLGTVVKGRPDGAGWVVTPLGRFRVPSDCPTSMLLLRREQAQLGGEENRVVGRVASCRFIPGRGYHLRLDNDVEAIVPQPQPLGAVCGLSFARVYCFPQGAADG